MSRHDLHKAARDVLSAWDRYGTAECLRGWIDRLRDAFATDLPALSAEPSEPVVIGVDWGRHGDRSCVSVIQQQPDGTAKVIALEYGPPAEVPAAFVEAATALIDALDEAMAYNLRLSIHVRERIDALRAQLAQIGGGR